MIIAGPTEHKIRHRKSKKSKTTISIINCTIERHARKFGESLPYRRFKDQDLNIKAETMPTCMFLTLRSALLHISDNFIYLFGLHIIFILPKFGRLQL